MSAIRTSRFVFIALALFLAAAAPAAAGTYSLSTGITDVTVFPDRARVERSGGKDLPAGTHLIEIKGIPTQAIENSFQVSATGPRGAQILGVETGVQFEPETLSREVLALQKKVDAKQAEVNGVDDRRAGINEELTFLKRLSESVATKGGESLTSAPRIDVAGWKNTLGFLQKEHTRLNRELRELEPAKKKLQGELRALQLELAKLQSQQRTRYRMVTLEVSLPNPGKVSVDLAYLTYGASWTPRYEARVDTGAEKLQLAYGAEVRQQSGDDWKGVDLTLSTARPSENQILPELSPWYIDVPRPMPRSLERAKRSGGGADMMMLAEAPASMEVRDEAAYEMDAPAVAIIDAGLSTEFKVARKQNIPSDGENHRVALQGIDLKAPLAARAVPKREEAAFLTSRVENSSEVPLLPGAMQVFRDGAFVGGSQMPAVLPGETFDLSLGRDPRFTIEREYVLTKRDEGGFFSKKVTREFHYRIKVKNFHKSARRIVILDQVPVAQDGRIEVKLGEGITPPNSAETDPGLPGKAAASVKRAPGDPTPRPGTLAWEYEIPAGGERTIELKFSVVHDAGIEVSGL
ncbi:MAG: mucoidy inhibitor MuiA family protein [Chrysiogenetes bacterium]|nr:mucoidy inhibitor MuiA family protein [Chrysiogenetes bacterium]